MVELPGVEATAPWRADALWRLGRLTLDYLLDSIELSRAGGDIVDRLLIAAILDANVGPVKQDLDLQLAYGSLDDAPPEPLLRPVSVNGLAQSLRLPFETVRRRVTRLARKGALVAGPRGVLVSPERLASPAFKALSLARYERLRRFYRDLADAQLLPGLPAVARGPATARDAGAAPVRIANRVLAEFLLRRIEAVMGLVGDPVDGLILLHMARANLGSFEGEAAPLIPVRTATLADLLALPPETVRRRLLALERRDVCRRSPEGAVLASEIVGHAAAPVLLFENARHVEAMFARLARLGVLTAWQVEP
jgi:DNA-binding Lrp family transcriptional regulator